MNLRICAVVSILGLDSSAGHAQRLDLFTAPDGATEAYYATGDEFLQEAFALADPYWNEIASNGLSQVRGHLDNYLPLELRSMRHKPAEAMMWKFAESFFAARDPQTGLIPGTAWAWHASHLVEQRNKQPVDLIAKAADLLEWFPDNAEMRARCVALAEATMRHFDYEYTPGEKAGMWGYVDVKGGEARGPITITQHYGSIAKGMAYLTQLTGDRRFLDWADQKMEFVWRTRLNPKLPILCDTFVPYSAVMNDGLTSDTDTLYYVRLLFKICEMTGNTKYRDWALAVTDLWLEHAWNAEWGHFIRKLRPDGSPANESLYGDAKYNTLHMLVAAYRVTKDTKYTERLKLAWQNLLRLNCDGLVAEEMTRGKTEPQRGFDPQQTIFIEILCDAYDATGDAEFLREAEAHATRVLRAGKKAMRLEGCQAGSAFLRVALARHHICRLELATGSMNARLKIAGNGKPLLDTQVPAQVAVVYLPAGDYQVQVNEQVRDITVDGDKAITLAEKPNH